MTDLLMKQKKQYCLALNFDLTLTDFHTRGNILNNRFYWENKQNLNIIIYLLEKFRELNFGIYIVTRNIESKVEEYIKFYGFGFLINRIYGAKNQQHMMEGTSAWFTYKLEYLNEISRSESIDKSKIYFYDNIIQNVKIAESNGFINSFLIDTNSNLSSSTILSMKLSLLLNSMNK